MSKKVYTVENAKGDIVDYEDGFLPNRRQEWKNYEKFATSETARSFTYRPKGLIFTAFIVAFLVGSVSVAINIPFLAVVGLLPLVMIWSVKWPGQQWYFRAGNPVPVPRFEDIFFTDKDGRPNPAIDRTLDGVVTLIRLSEESRNVRDLVESPMPWMFIGMIAVTFLAVGAVVGVVLAR